MVDGVIEVRDLDNGQFYFKIKYGEIYELVVYQTDGGWWNLSEIIPEDTHYDYIESVMGIVEGYFRNC